MFQRSQGKHIGRYPDYYYRAEFSISSEPPYSRVRTPQVVSSAKENHLRTLRRTWEIACEELDAAMLSVSDGPVSDSPVIKKSPCERRLKSTSRSPDKGFPGTSPVRGMLTLARHSIDDRVLLTTCCFPTPFCVDTSCSALVLDFRDLFLVCVIDDRDNGVLNTPVCDGREELRWGVVERMGSIDTLGAEEHIVGLDPVVMNSESGEEAIVVLGSRRQKSLDASTQGDRLIRAQTPGSIQATAQDVNS